MTDKMKNVKYVDTSIGTVGEADDKLSHGGGKTYPGACVPAGAVQLSPDTVTGGDNGTGYNYCHNTIEGFSFNHLSGIGWYGDLGNLQMMPVTFVEDLRSGSNEEVPFLKGTRGWKSEFSHENEVTHAGYYSIMLDRYGILAEATASSHTGYLRFTYPENETANLILNFSRRIGGKADFEEVEVVSNTRLEGHIKCTPKGGGFGRGHGGIEYDLYFVCEFSAPAESVRFFSNEEYAPDGLTQFSGEDVGAAVSFGKLNAPLTVRCSISYVDADGAKNNLVQTGESFDFDTVCNNAKQAWQSAFECIEVEGENETDLTLFYTCLYHALLDPRTMADKDGRFRLNGKVFENGGYSHRTVFSGWDVYRSEFPLLTIIDPEAVRDTVCSLLKISEEKNASLPRWELLGIDATCMVGDPGAIVLCDAALKGIEPYDTQKAYEIIKASVTCKKELFGKPFKSARPDCVQYTDGCYVPKKLSDTLEYLLADYTTAQLAKKLGKDDDADFFMRRAARYKENYNKCLGFMAPRGKKGHFCFEFNRYGDNGCVESNVFQQSWFVPYDVEGLSELFGKKRTVKLLEKFFSKADFSKLWNLNYNHSNEPCHNITHYFSMLGLPERTQYWTRRVQKEAYRLGAYGFCGNEDVGQLSAWYVLSALGFAQVCPADERYWLNTPLFKKATVKLNEKYHNCAVSNTLTVECDKDPLEYPYIDAVYFNGEKVSRNFLKYGEITSGGTLKMILKKAVC